ncbi:flagellar biosynthetic protein FliP, partial [Clostridium perfringens]|nr:flagellar biosynthetic protein FliP [Clostridium perfringens]
MSKKKKYLFMMLIALALIFTFDKAVSAEPI